MSGIVTALTWVWMISFDLELSKVKALPELSLALDSSAGSGQTCKQLVKAG
jgi:hypothetical protein